MNKINIEKLKEIILENLKDKSPEMKRVFHGRGNFYDDYNYLVIDNLNDILLATLFQEIPQDIEKQIINVLEEVYEEKQFKSLVLQRRYKKDNLNEVLKGIVPKDSIAIENALKYKINFSNQNIGIFPDMKVGREYIQSIVKIKIS